MPLNNQEEKIINFFDQIIASKNSDPQADISELERTIDILVYKLYELTLEDSQIIDPTLTQDKWERVNFE